MGKAQDAANDHGYNSCIRNNMEHENITPMIFKTLFLHNDLFNLVEVFTKHDDKTMFYFKRSNTLNILLTNANDYVIIREKKMIH